jgi:hypothetical protein
MKKVSGTTKAFVRLAQSNIHIAYSPLMGSLRVYHLVLSSADPDWNNARFFYIVYDESAKEWGDRGYGVITHPGGDQTFIKFLQRLTPASGADIAAESEGFFIGGTGKFKDIKARWLLKLKGTVTEGLMAEWEVEYF